MAKKRQRIILDSPLSPTSEEISRELRISRKEMRQIVKRVDEIINEDKITISLADCYLFLVATVRYALGRKSYITGFAQRQVREIAPRLAEFQRKVLADSIRECGDYGNKYLKDEWLNLLRWLDNFDRTQKRAK